MRRSSRIALLVLGVAIMWVESRFTPSPGIGFALAMGCIAWAAVG